MIISQEFSKITHESKTYKKYSFLYVTTATQHRDSFRTTAVRHWGWSILSLSFRDVTWQRLSSMEDQSFIMMANRFCVVVVVVSRSKTQTLDAWKCNQPEIGRELIKREASVHGKAKEPGENEAKWREAMVTCSVNHPLGRQHSAILFGLQILHQWDFRRALSKQTFQVVIWNIFRGLTWSCLVPSWCWC